MLFDYLKAITSTKTTPTPPLEEYIPFLITRWLSFGVPAATPALNETVNSLGNMSKETHFKLLKVLFPKFNRYIKFNYIKRGKTTDGDSDEKKNTLTIAKNLELSTREINLYQKTVEFLNSTSK
jgi:hypothetical protein